MASFFERPMWPRGIEVVKLICLDRNKDFPYQRKEF